jgi:hypothetical protein
MVNTKLPLQRSKTRRIEGFGENVSQLALYVNELHLYISFSQHGLTGSGVSL